MYSNTKKNLLVLNLRETKDDTNVYIFQKKQQLVYSLIIHGEYFVILFLWNI